MSEATQFSKVRIEALCDGVFAIAMTLLVLDLKVPDLPKTSPAIDVWRALGEHRMSFFAFMLTFMLAGAYWMQHHVFFHYLAHATRSLALLNLVFLMFVSLLPFSTSFYAAYGPRQPGIGFYFGNQFILALLLAAQWTMARRQGLLSGASTDPKRARFVAVLVGLMVMMGSLFVMSLVSPEATGLATLPGLVIILVIRRRAERRARAAAEK